MTKIKNTKKGMAKKTLSMSLVVAMLATSNVPVWAAEFSDGTDAAVTSEAEVPVVTDTATDEFSDSETETPVVEDTAEADVATIDTAADVNLENYTVEGLKIKSTTGDWKWGNQVTVEGTIKKDGVNVPNLQYTWLADDREATEDTESATGTNYSGNLGDITYTPSIDDFQKTLSLRIYKLGTNGSVIFSKTITGKTVEAKDISNQFNDALTYGKKAAAYPTEVTYNGDEQKPTPSNTYNVTVDSVNNTTATITANDIDWHYETKDGDLTNVTDNDVVVYGTLIGTTDRTSAAYGYTAKTNSATYQIKPFEVASKKNIAVSLTKTAVEYTGASTLQFGKSDIKLEVKVGDKNIDITAALKDKLTEGTITGSGNIGERAATVDGLTGQFATTDAAKKILKNFDFSGASPAYKTTTTNKYTVSKRDLRTCTGSITKEYNLDTFKGKDPTSVSLDLSTIELTGADGQTFTLDKIKGDVVVQINNVVFEAAENEEVGTVENAVTISYRNNSTKVTGTITLPLTLVSKSLNNVEANVYYKVNNFKGKDILGTSKTGTMPSVPYIRKAYDILDTTSTLKNDIYGVEFKDAGNNNETLKVGEYTVSYNDNVNAGTVEVTLTGKGSYAGSVKKFYFKIAKDEVTAKEFKVATGVTINPANNNDPSLYKDALKAKFETTLADGTKAILEDGKDYTVKYYYGKKGATSVTELKSQKAGTNNVGDYVYAVVTLADNGNYTTSDTFIAGSAVINKKSISDVTVSVEKDSYTFTGKEIVPNITVKDGSSVLEKGVDYTLKFKDNINAGTATVSVIPTAKSDYDTSTVATATFKIEAANAEDVKVELSTKANGTVTDKFAYTGKQVKPVVVGVKLNGVDVKDFFDITYPTYGENINAGKDMGSITITPKTSPANFTGSKTQLFTIVGKELTGGLKIYNVDKTLIGVYKDQALQTGSAAYPKLYSFRYDGTAQTFGSEVFTADSKFSVTKDTDYEIKYINNVDAGVGFVAVVAKGNYEGHRDTDFGLAGNNYWLNNTDGIYCVEDGVLYQKVGAKKTAIQNNIVDIIGFNIEPAYFTAKNISVTNGTYAGGVPVKPQVTVSVNGTVLTEGTDYTLTLTAIDSVATPDKFVNVTAGKPYYVTVNAKGGYQFDTVNGTNTFVWGIDKKDLKDCTVVVDKNLKATVTNGNVIEEKENFTVKDNGDGTATVSVVDGGKNYTGSVNVEIGGRKVGAPMISNVKVVGNKATVILSDEVDGASGYDYVISTDKDCITSKNYTAVNKNQAKTSTTFKYVDQGTYYAYCHAWTRDANGKKVFGEWSKGYEFSVTATTPDAPVIKSVKVSGSTVKVTYELSANATGYDVVLGTSSKKDNGELRPYNYGAHKVLNLKESTVTATFKNVPAGTWTVGMHAFNRTSLDGKKVFSPWSNLKTAKVK